MVYLANFFICWILAKREVITKTACVLMLSVLVAIFGFRHHVGTDWNNYVAIYNIYLTDPGYSSPSRGYIFDYISRFFASNFDSVHYLNAFLFLIFASGIIYYAKILRWGGFFLLYSLGYLIPVVMVGVRQAAAIGLIFILVAVYNRIGFIKRLLIIMAAAGFHQSALVFFATPFISILMKNGYRRISIFLIFFAVTMAFFYGFSSDSYSYLIVDSVDSLGALQHIMLIVFPITASLILRKAGNNLKVVENDAHYVMLFILLVSILVMFVNTTTADRMSLYCYPLVAYAISQQISCAKNNFLKIIYPSLGFLIFWIWYFFANNSATFRDYSNFWI